MDVVATTPSADPADSTEPGDSNGVIGVVIVDDHLLVADGLAATLNALSDVTVLAIAGTCVDGLSDVSRCRPDVLLLDQRLPDGLGTDLLPALFLACPTMKVLLVTAEASDDLLIKAIEGGCAGFIRKGARASDLTTGVRAAANDEAVIGADDLRRLMPRLRQARRVGDDLTPRERTILNLLVDGASTAGIARELLIAVATARNHVQAVINKLGAHSRLEAVAIAFRENIITRT